MPAELKFIWEESSNKIRLKMTVIKGPVIINGRIFNEGETEIMHNADIDKLFEAWKKGYESPLPEPPRE